MDDGDGEEGQEGDPMYDYNMEGSPGSSHKRHGKITSIHELS